MKQVIKAFAIILVALLYVELSAGDFEKKAPYTEIKWSENGTVPIVKVGAKDYELLEINNVSVKEIIGFCKKHFGDKAYKRFNEDLPEVFHNMKVPLGDKVELLLKEPSTGRIIIKKEVPMTEKNRDLIMQNQTKAVHKKK